MSSRPVHLFAKLTIEEIEWVALEIRQLLTAAKANGDVALTDFESKYLKSKLRKRTIKPRILKRDSGIFRSCGSLGYEFHHRAYDCDVRWLKRRDAGHDAGGAARSFTSMTRETSDHLRYTDALLFTPESTAMPEPQIEVRSISLRHPSQIFSMTLPTDFVATLTCPPINEIITELQRKERVANSRFLALKNEIAPSDLYCYFGARFGAPNGPQNMWRTDSSDNLIHWEWMLRTPTGWALFQGMNFRTAVLLLGDLSIEQIDMPDLVSQIKADFANHGRQMAQLRKSLEDWTEFVNPYQRIRSSVNSLLRELEALQLRPEDEEIPDVTSAQQAMDTDWSDVAARYSKGLGLCFGIRSMLPVMAEAFVNLLLFAFMRPELKTDERLRENAIRQPIDVRIKSLSLNCVGFETQVDYKHEAFKAYHSLVNERNDLLHGNVVLEKLKFNEVYFNGRVPVFKRYRSLWERTVGVDIQAVGLHRLANEMQVVDRMVSQLKSHLAPTEREFIEQVCEQRDLGLDQARGKFGVLFSRRLVDMFVPDADAASSDNDA